MSAVNRFGQAENEAEQYYKSTGWTIHRLGPIDFLLVRDDAGATRVAFREVKGPADTLKKNQREIFKSLREAGCDAKVLLTATMTEVTEENVFSPGYPKDEAHFTARIPDEVFQQMEKSRKRQNMNRTEFVRKAIETFSN